MVEFLPALAAILAANVPNIGHVYDQSADDPTPDTVTLPTDGKPVGIFVDPYELRYDTDGQGGTVPTFGYGGLTTDESTVLFILLHGAAQLQPGATLQRWARPFVRYAVKDAIRQHNTLGGGVWRAVCASAKGGPFQWGGVDYYATQYTITVADERSVAAGG